MSVSGNIFQVEDFFSPARMNRKCATHLSGSEIAALSPVYPNQLIVCNVTENGFTADTAYLRNTANTAWIGLSGGKHKHDQDNEASGGLLSDVFIANLQKTMRLNYINPAIGEFMLETASGGSGVNDPTGGRINLSTGTTNGGYAHMSKSGVALDFSKNSKFGFKGYATANTMLSYRLGVAMENVNASVDNLKKYGLEVCDSAGTARTIEVICADGTTRSTAASTEDASQASARFYMLDFTVAQNVKFYVNGVLRSTNSSNVPASGRSSGIYNIGAGIKSNSTSGKNLYIYAIAFAGTISDNVWG